MVVMALSDAPTVAWICMGLGVLVLLAGAGLGMVLSLKPAADANDVNKAKQELQRAEQKVKEANAELAALGTRGLEAGGAPDTTKASEATESAATSTQAAQSALQQVTGAIASLPERVRFAGLLVLVGAVLISVATVQFGGTSLF